MTHRGDGVWLGSCQTMHGPGVALLAEKATNLCTNTCCRLRKDEHRFATICNNRQRHATDCNAGPQESASCNRKRVSTTSCSASVSNARSMTAHVRAFRAFALRGGDPAHAAWHLRETGVVRRRRAQAPPNAIVSSVLR